MLGEIRSKTCVEIIKELICKPWEFSLHEFRLECYFKAIDHSTENVIAAVNDLQAEGKIKCVGRNLWVKT